VQVDALDVVPVRFDRRRAHLFEIAVERQRRHRGVGGSRRRSDERFGWIRVAARRESRLDAPRQIVNGAEQARFVQGVGALRRHDPSISRFLQLEVDADCIARLDVAAEQHGLDARAPAVPAGVTEIDSAGEAAEAIADIAALGAFTACAATGIGAETPLPTAESRCNRFRSLSMSAAC
jgi:hypothetical protein